VVSKIALGQNQGIRLAAKSSQTGVPIETKKTGNAILSRVHQVSARDAFSELALCQ